MKNCEQFEDDLQSLIAGNCRLEQLEELIVHCKSCQDCLALYEMHRKLEGFGSRFDELESVDLWAARGSIIQKVMAKAARPSRFRWLNALVSPFTLRPLAATVLVAVFFMLGFAASRYALRSTAPAMEMTDEAFLSARLKDMKHSPYSFTNATVQFLDENRVSLSIDVTKHVVIVEPAHSELVKGILLNSQFNPSFTGAVGHFQNSPPKQKLVF